jgi:fatty-acyl-CoA synthase
VGANLADRFEAVTDEVPRVEALVVDGDRWTYGELDERAARLATVLADQGIGPGDRVGVLLGNTNEHLEVLLACCKLRAAAVNLNTRYVAAELADVVAHSRSRLVVHEADLGHLVPGAGIARGQEYERALADAAPAARIPRSGDDLYVLYTGGTTDAPKGVVWRHEDLRRAALAPDVDLRGRRMLVASPFFHGTGQWMALATLLDGGTVVTTRHRSIRPDVIWTLAARERASHLAMVGDAYAEPLVRWLEANPGAVDLAELNVIASGGATLSPALTERLLAAVPDVVVVDGYGASETGGHGRAVAVAGAPRPTSFAVDDDTAILDDDLSPIPPTSSAEGWLARRGPLPLGYDGGAGADDGTFVTTDAGRWAIPGDRARWAGPGRIELLGRAGRAINTGGEKVHAEEVEAALRDHPAVAEVVVLGVEHERWGEVVTAIVQPHGDPPTLDELAKHCRTRLAGFKVPRRVVVVDEVRRTAAGKPDLTWARSVSSVSER